MSVMLDPVELVTKLIGGVWGHLVGDAVGVPYEFRTADAVGTVRWGESGSHGQPPGTWSDDGALMLALLDALLLDEPGPKDTVVRPRFDTEVQGQRIVAGATRRPTRPTATACSTSEARRAPRSRGSVPAPRPRRPAGRVRWTAATAR